MAIQMRKLISSDHEIYFNVQKKSVMYNDIT